MKLTSLSSITAAVVLGAPIAAQNVLSYLPKDTILAVSAPDLSKSLAEFQNMPLAKMWAEEEVQTFFADAIDMAKEQIGQGLEMARQMHANGQFPINPDDLLKLRVNGGTFALTHMEMIAGDWGPMPKFGIVVHLDFGESAPTWNALIQMGIGMLMAEEGDDIQRTEAKIGDLNLMTLKPKDGPPGLDMSLNVAMVPNGIVIGTLTDDVTALLTNMTAKKATLTSSPAYQAAAKRIDVDGAEAQIYVSPDPMIDFAFNTLKMAAKDQRELQAVDMDGVERALQAMGLRDLGSAAMATQYKDGKCITRQFHATSGGEQTAATKAVDTSFLKWVPKDAVSFSAGTMDVASIYDTALKGLQAYDPEFAKMALGKLSELEGQLGFTIRGDLFGSIGDHYITWSMPMGTISSAPEMAFLLKVNNEDNLVRSLKNMAALTNGMVEIEEGTRRGLKAYQVRVNFDPMDGMGMNIFDMLQPTFSFKDGYMVVGFSASDVKRVFKRMDREDNPKGDIRSNKEFIAVKEGIPSGVSSVTFTDWKANFESLYQLLTGVLAFVPMPEDVPIDMSLLPDSETLTQHLYASLSYTKTDANGMETVDVSPFGPETWVALGAAVGAGAGAAVALQGRRGF